MGTFLSKHNGNASWALGAHLIVREIAAGLDGSPASPYQAGGSHLGLEMARAYRDVVSGFK